MPRNSYETTPYGRLCGLPCNGETRGGARHFTVGRVFRSLRASATVITCFLALSACTTQLQVKELNSRLKTIDGKSPTTGVVYYLPAVDFKITATWKLESCENGSARATLNLDVTERYLADRGRPFLLDYTWLESLFTHTDLSVSLYSNGTLQSINGDIKDSTGTVVASTLDLARSAAQIQHVALHVAHNGAPANCTEKATKSLMARNNLALAIRDLEHKIVTMSEQNPLSGKSLRRLRKLNQKLATKRAAYTVRLAETSFREPFTWMPSTATMNMTFKMNEQGRRKLFDGEYQPPNSCFRAGLEGISPMRDTQKSNIGGDVLLPENSKSRGGHLFYRVPAFATLKLQTERGELLARKEVRLPQFGVDVALPLVNNAFDRANLVAKFDESGALTEFRYVRNAQLEGLTQALAKTVKTANEILETRQGRELKKLQGKTDLLKARAELIKAERDLQALEDAGLAESAP